MKPNIYILTGEIGTGKTTSLQNWATHTSDVFGIISPVVNNVRMFMNVQTKEMVSMEATAEESNVLAVGRYTFSKSAFAFANEAIQSALKNTSGWLLIDECGPLELKGEGLHKAIQAALKVRNPHVSLVLVVRLKLLNEVIAHYGLQQEEIQIIHSSFFKIPL